MTDNLKLINEWLKQYLLEKNLDFYDKRYETKTIMSMEILLEKPPDLYLQKQTLLSNLPFHKQLKESVDIALLYQVLIDFIDYLL
ncbi:hypothetical protein [Streptococcus plurextorum]|uniref:hypothetical protein n=1 Tax=Streptococcus plurextorum TaxID=456876 RepID=UPI00040DA602|nr:hypothetical protein [Streptococcus plurextorum]